MAVWFRFYTEVLEDPKVQNLPTDAYKFWTSCLILASRNEGYLPDLESVSFAFRRGEDETQKILQFLEERGLLDDKKGRLTPHNWFKRQYKSDSSTPRVKQFRERQRNVSETLPKRPQRQIQNQIQNTETEQIKYIAPSALDEDFERLWFDYPLKDGKKAALRGFRASVKTPADVLRCVAALGKYLEHLRIHPQKLCKNGSTWFNNWQDWEGWVEPTAKPNGNGYHPPTKEEIEAATAELRRQGAIR